MPTDPSDKPKKCISQNALSHFTAGVGGIVFACKLRQNLNGPMGLFSQPLRLSHEGRPLTNPALRPRLCLSLCGILFSFFLLVLPVCSASAQKAIIIYDAPEADPRAAIYIKEMKKSNNVRDLMNAGHALENIGAPAVPALIEALRQKQDERLRLIAAYTLQRLGASAAPAVPALTEALRQSKDEALRLTAADALGNIGAPAVPALTEALRQSQDDDLRLSAVAALGKMNFPASPAVPALMEALRQSQDDELRLRAAEALGNIGAPASAAVPALVEALKQSQYKDLRLNATEALGSIGAPAFPAVPALMEALRQRQDEELRLSAAVALGNIGAPASAAVPALVEALKQKQDESLRYNATYALGKMGFSASPAVPALVEALRQRLDEGLCLRAAAALGNIGVPASAAVPALVEALRQRQDEILRYNATYALGNIGAPASAAVPALVEALRQSQYKDLRLNAAVALGNIGAPASAAVPALVEALRQKQDEKLRYNAADALGKMGFSASAAVPALVEALRQSQYDDLRFRAAGALRQVAGSLQDNANIVPLSQLNNAIPALDKAFIVVNTVPGQEDVAASIESSIKAIKVIRGQRQPGLMHQAISLAQKYPVWAVVVLWIPFFLLLWSLLLGLYPLGLLRLNDFLRPFSAPLPSWIGGNKVSVRTLTLLCFFNYVPRVLDAWVATYQKEVQDRFAAKNTVRDREVHVSIPVILNKRSVPELNVKDLQAMFSKEKAFLLIWGEGGAGKTSLACMIAQWAADDDAAQRLAKHRILPVLIEDELTTGDAGKRLVEAVRGQLQDLIGASKLISEELIISLLRRQRILVIVDHFSEMSEATRTEIKPERADFPANALIVTSRVEEGLGQVTRTTLKPQRIEGNRLSLFMDAYLTQRGKRGLFDDPEYFNACGRLSEMVGDRNITVLLAKLYAEQMISIKENDEESELPNNIPDLMLRYVNELNRGIEEGKMNDRDVQTAAKTIAWECLRPTFRPTPVSRTDILAALGGDAAESCLVYLEDRLRLVQTVGEGRDRVRFLLDPLSEYLAGQHLLETNGASGHNWQVFLDEAAGMSGSPEAIAGFLLAVRDCCVTKGVDYNIPPSVADKLGSMTKAGAKSPSQPEKSDAQTSVVLTV